MQTRFLLGPAGSGKTHRCLGEIRAELIARPAGLPLVFLAPKQATFQIERQLLEDGSLSGYTRLQIVSFERLAQMMLEEAAGPPPRILSEEGRVMVLRALLAAHESELRIFHAAARLPGFAQQLGGLLRELQRHQLGPERLAQLSEHAGLTPPLQAKLHDLALLLRAYQDWLKQQGLQDPNRLLDLATAELRRQNSKPGAPLRFGGLWLDGFAEMTPQELDFLAALAPQCEHATLAFCLEGRPREEVSWLSTWSVVSQTFRHCYTRLHAVAGAAPVVEILPRGGAGRFVPGSALAHLEAHWAETAPPAFGGAPAVRLLPCAHPEAEAVRAAREILAHVQNGGRFREVAVLLRRLETHAVYLKRVFARYDIPYFIDQREPVGHHPLAELTRYALRVAAWGWRNEDWFGALKTGLAGIAEAALDELENTALERGWDGEKWLEPFEFDAEERDQRAAWCAEMEDWRGRLTQPFLKFRGALGKAPAGAALANALRTLWDDLGAGNILQQWAETVPPGAGMHPAVHATVWEGLHAWLDNLELGFGEQAMPLRDWLPVLEAGLGQLTVGVIPPALDQVMIGAVDRSRNPELELALVLGMNETLFPAPSAPAPMLSDDDRRELEQAQVFLGLDPRHRLGHERYYGYIACTRARSRLVVTWALADAEGGALNPSPFVSHLEKMFPGAREEVAPLAAGWPEAAHVCELLPVLLRRDHSLGGQWPELAAELQRLRDYAPADQLTPATAAALYGQALETSVSALEKFGMCPFRFFVTAGLGAREREVFEVDALQIGSFQHDVLQRFHEELATEDRKWRDLTGAEARQRVARITEQVAETFGRGLFAATAQNQFTRDALSRALQDFIEVAVEWMATYQFDPTAVELGFGLPNDPLPAWSLDLGEGRALRFRGRIDRIDLCCGTRPGEHLCVVIDYKSSERKLDPVLLEHGIQMQLPAYLSVVRHLPELRAALGVEALVPAGVFYVNLRGKPESSGSRAEAFADPAQARRRAYQHRGRFDFAVFNRLDSSAGGDSGQFACRVTSKGFHGGDTDPKQTAAFLALLETVEGNLRRMGREIFAGNARVDPYQKGKETACDKCECRAVCRIDFWTHQFRRLPSPGKRG